MGLGVSLILIAVGAILTWAVDAQVSGLNVNAVGVILMIVGLIGGLFSLAFWSSWWGPGYFNRYATAGSAPVRRRRMRLLPQWSKSRPPRSRKSSKSGNGQGCVTARFVRPPGQSQVNEHR
jgi:hypothetical protein